MDMRRTLQRALGTACLAASVVITQPSQAVEYGFSAYFLGLTIPMSGYVLPPGLYFNDTFLLYHGSIYQGSRPVFTGQFVVNIAQVGWYLDTELFGATPGIVALVPFVGSRTSIPALFADRVTRDFRQTADLAALGDADFSAVLGWHAGDNNWGLVLTGFAPTGNYNPHRFVQTSLNRPALDIKGAYTFLSQQTGTEVSGGLGMTFNALNTATNYQSGVELHLEWALNQHFPFGLAAGVGGYFYQQLSDDYGSGATAGPNRGRIAAVGPLLSYTLRAGAQELNLSGRWFHEFAVKHRVRGDSIFASLSFPL